ncbi:hypothetical protein AURDEDRAFT_166999 [Auricularia subglabra TFB-10046 SS5]|nr:hypothetical protein AURDEDRAFT_166999 [Auricularia subglabra TFB-10046 SS5]
MSFAADLDPNAGWAAVAEPPPPRDVIKEAIEKDKVIKDITAAQNDLRVIISKIQAAEADCDKLSSGNATLQMYIDNLTKQIAGRR